MQLLAKTPRGFQFYFTDRSDGDATQTPVLAAALRSVRRDDPALPMARLTQVHSARSIVLEGPGPDGLSGGEFCNLGEGDAIVTSSVDLACVVLVADCAPVAIYDPQGQICAVVHAGWRGVAGGIIASAVGEMRSRGASDLVAVVGPHARPCCYSFTPSDIATLSEEVGCDLTGVTRDGDASLDLGRAISFQLAAVGVSSGSISGQCTICEGQFFSYRRQDLSARNALVLLPPS